MTKEKVIEEFTKLKGVGKAKAELLYTSGFDSLEKLKKASIDDLVRIKGINEKLAQNLKNQLEGTTKETKTTPETKQKKKKEKLEKTVEKEPKEEKREEKVEIVEEKKEYIVKKKPKISKEIEKKLALRRIINQRRPQFLREEWFRYKRIPQHWRKPSGMTSKMRMHLKYRPSAVRVGFRGPKEVRGLHPSGFEEIMVYNVHDLERLDPKKHAVRIGGTVGTKKRLEIAKKADELELRILNMKGSSHD